MLIVEIYINILVQHSKISHYFIEIHKITLYLTVILLATFAKFHNTYTLISEYIYLHSARGSVVRVTLREPFRCTLESYRICIHD